MVLDHSWSCDPTAVHLYRTNTDGITVSSGGRMNWSTRPLPSSYRLDSWSGNANEAGGCGKIQPDADAVFESTTMKNDVQARARANATTYTVGLCACNADGDYESSQGRWKKFYTNKTYLVVTYDRKPNPPVGQAFSATTDCYKACTSPAVVRTTTPTLVASVSDPYNGNLADDVRGAYVGVGVGDVGGGQFVGADENGGTGYGEMAGAVRVGQRVDVLLASALDG